MISFDQLPETRPLRATHEVALRRELEGLAGASPHRWRPWRRSGFAFALTLATVASGVGVAAAAVYADYETVTNTNTAHCYSLAQLGDNGSTVAASGAPGSRAQVTDALGTCETLWQDGFLSPGVSQVIHVTMPTTLHPVPPLVVCTMSDGTAGVFPGTASTCSELGLAQPKSVTSGYQSHGYLSVGTWRSSASPGLAP
jgi:uncharacterized membrane protein